MNLLDLLFVVAALGFFLICLAYVIFCDRLGRPEAAENKAGGFYKSGSIIRE
jgi:hypothetical protein